MDSVACQGAEGSFSHLAGKTFFTKPFSLVETRSFKEIFSAIHEERAIFGVLPIENSLVGSIYENYDLICQHEIPIRGEVYLRVEHHLLVVPDDRFTPQERLTKLSKVLSHPKALEQCQLLFTEYPNLTPRPFSDTAGAAREVSASSDITLAAIASREAADVYGLSLLLSNIEDDSENYTRFLVIGHPDIPHRAPLKVSLVATLEHRPGTLLDVLSALHKGGGDLTKIESRPVRGKPFEYLFYLDVIHPGGSAAIQRDLGPLTRSLKILGEYEARGLPRQSL